MRAELAQVAFELFRREGFTKGTTGRPPRRALNPVVERYRLAPASSLAMTRLAQDTPALCTRRLEKQHGWRPALAEALAALAPHRPRRTRRTHTTTAATRTPGSAGSAVQAPFETGSRIATHST